jgi:hypothetical protein
MNHRVVQQEQSSRQVLAGLFLRAPLRTGPAG